MYTCLIDGVCFAIIYRLGFGDQVKVGEYMPDDKGYYFDNEGHDSKIFENKEDLLKRINVRYPGIKYETLWFFNYKINVDLIQKIAYNLSKRNKTRS